MTMAVHIALLRDQVREILYRLAVLDVPSQESYLAAIKEIA